MPESGAVSEHIIDPFQLTYLRLDELFLGGVLLTCHWNVLFVIKTSSQIWF